MRKVFLFDFDGTIADSMETLVTIFNTLVDTYHLPRKVTEKDIPFLRKHHLREIIKEFGIPLLKIPFIMWAARKEFSKQISTIKPFKEIKQTLLQLKKQNILLGIVSSNKTANIDEFLKENGIDIFNFIHSEQGLFGKDKVLKHVIHTYQLHVSDVYYVGDEIRDIEAAKRVGIKMIAVTWGANEKEALKNAHPDFLIDKPSDLLKIR